MRLGRRPWVRWGALLLALSAVCRADGAASVVWYRGSAECPTGPDFLLKLGPRASLAKLANAGDHIDYIVTLVATPGEAVGRLERQTQTGTVAIRELRDATCGSVADALVLSLGLSLDPERPRAAAPEATVPELEAPPQVPPADAPDAPPEVVPSGVTEPAPASAASHRGTILPEHPRWSVGAGGGVVAGVTPGAMGAASAFVDVERLFAPLGQLSLRAGFAGAFGSTGTAIGSVSRSVLAARVEACPLRWGHVRWSFRPCLFADVGATSAASARETTVRGTSPWVAVGAALRGAIDLVGPVGLEATAGGFVPLVRNEIGAGNDALYSDGSAAFDGRMGVFVRLR